MAKLLPPPAFSDQARSGRCPRYAAIRVSARGAMIRDALCPQEMFDGCLNDFINGGSAAK